MLRTRFLSHLGTLAVALLLAGGALATAEELVTNHFQVEGMTCALCATAIERGLMRQDGIKRVEIDRPAERVAVVHNPEVTPQRIVLVIESVGNYRAAWIQDVSALEPAPSDVVDVLRCFTHADSETRPRVSRFVTSGNREV